MQRTPQESDMAADGFAAGEPGNGLVDHRLENRGRKVFLGSPLIDERLDVGFGEDAAACRNGIEGAVVFGVFV